MSRSKLGFLVAAIATSSVIGVSSVSANPQNVEQLIQAQNELRNKNAQVTSVSQFSDVQPTDWAFTALQSLVERYGCIAGYPNGTFRGNRATSRYEFAAGLNACLDKINELISEGLADKVGKEDLATLQKLQEEFSAELAALKGRVTALEAKTATLEAQQFSTTTKLSANVTTAFAGLISDNPSVTGENTTLSARVRLNFNSSFTGSDLLRVRLQAGNVPTFNSVSGTNITRLGFDGGNNTFVLDDLYYRFPLSKDIRVFVGTSGFELDDVLNPISRQASGDTGALSRFGRFDPLLFRGIGTGTGAGFNWKIGNQLALNAAYVTAGANDPETGVFGNNYQAAVQAVFSPSKNINLGLAYSRGYTSGAGISSSTGTGAANNPFGGAKNVDTFGVQAEWGVSPNFNVGGWFSYAKANSTSSGNNADIINWATTFSFLNLFAPGNEAVIVFGQPPYITSASAGTTASNSKNAGNQNPYHIEALYKFRLNKNIQVTPGLITILNPGVGSNQPVFVGVLRTSFSF